ncbi:Ubiquitin carboxyl-terminal hydrolase 4 [Colletotrichum chlorophyti]|uniref:Ubiquitin carboxyl-terminal hydrolase 4 n=1 Tax=Colletotrichum chlorophyti TaxID=708187 RepID=A0A1Q8RLX2_9PEZI|nr:Ubiquitin carboxyl-terminal hydrolase 4 [Colletotrichum chlorophyti]
MTSTASSATRTVLGGGGPAISNGTALHTFAMGGDGGPAGRSGKPPLPHIDDLTSTAPSVDMNLPLRKILEMGDNAMRQAETFRDFGRPDMAFKEYIKASLIAVKFVPMHTEAVSLKGGRGDLNRIYTALMKKIDSQHGAFERIKADIIADNQKTGVRPTSSRPTSVTNGGAIRPQATQSPPLASPTRAEAATKVNGSAASKAKPVIHPKPQSLHGAAIRPGAGGSGLPKSKAAEDLAARFANLRGPVALPGQDPRIRTHPIVPPRPLGPRAMPESPEKPKVAVVTNLPDLPKMPDAIYSPARGTVSNEAASLPSSTPRGLFSRTGSSATINTTLANKAPDYFALSHNAPNAAPVSAKPQSFTIPEGDSITAEDLMSFIKRGSATIQVLIIDVRSRVEFDEGHILSQAVICIEPSILLRENISSEQIAESMVLSPAQEYHHFERRDAFDLVVFHDQDSDSIPRYMSPDMNAAALLSLQRALTYFNYGKELKNPPKLLQGGLDAWTDLMGRNALATSATAGVARAPQVRSPMKRPLSISKSNQKYKVTPLKPEEIKIWEETLQNDDIETARSPGFMHVRSTEEFLRRFPAVSAEQESMQSPISPGLSSQHHGQNHADFYSDLPSPPTRPAPAVPRPSYSGLSQTQDDHETPGTVAIAAQARAAKQGPLTPPSAKPKITGLNNPGSWCYANSTIQTLRMSPGFGQELSGFGWQETYKVPRTSGEKNDHPQLMLRIISNLFHWLSSNKFEVMKAQTLMDYSLSVCTKSGNGYRNEEFGGPSQQDAQEFMAWLMTYLHDETNRRRNLESQPLAPEMTDKSMLEGALEWWQKYSQSNSSIVDEYWRGLEVTTVVCSRCKNRTYTWEPFICLTVPILPQTRKLEQCLQEYRRPESIPDYKCDRCNMKLVGEKQTTLARLPKLLCLCLRRFDSTGQKNQATVTWDFTNLSLDQFFIPNNERTIGGSLDQDIQADYECYAIVVHMGTKITSGHYICYVRDTSDSQLWYKISDERVQSFTFDGIRHNSSSQKMLKDGDAVPYMVFFRRKQGRSAR